MFDSGIPSKSGIYSRGSELIDEKRVIWDMEISFTLKAFGKLTDKGQC
jgi:hypothetical protein